MGTKNIVGTCNKKQQQNISYLYVYKVGISNDNVSIYRKNNRGKVGRERNGRVCILTGTAGLMGNYTASFSTPELARHITVNVNIHQLFVINYCVYYEEFYLTPEEDFNMKSKHRVNFN